MDAPKFQQHGGPHARQNRPYWKHMHHSPFFWVATVCLLLGMTVYVITNNLAFWPGEPTPTSGPASTP